MKVDVKIIPFMICMIFAGGCATEETQDTSLSDTLAAETDTTSMQETTATAQLQPTEGNNAAGTIEFTSGDGEVRVIAHITGLEPGQHGIHVHEFGDCSAPDASSAGEHFAPQSSPHGSPDDLASQRHAGDLGNLDADSNGEAHYEYADQVLALSGPNSIVGKAVVVHADPDDLETQPSGNSGDRVACGVIQMGGLQGMPADSISGDSAGASGV
jgi:superoxide dismutase, Cu-Zn family